MLSRYLFPAELREEKKWLYVFYAFSVLLLASIFLSGYLENPFPLLIPFSLLFVYLSIRDIRFIYLLLLVTIPLSVEVALPDGFSTDFPTELLIGGIMILFFVLVLSRRGIIEVEFMRNPIIFFVLLHFAWAVFATLFSKDSYVSIKWLLAKTWYVTTFVFVTSTIIKKDTDFKRAFWCLFIPLVFTIIYTLLHHAQTGFSFQTVNTPMLPFFRNHVNYACTIAQMIPFTILAISWFKKGTSKRKWMNISLVLLLVAVYLSYTRSAWLALTAAVVMIPIIRLNLTKPVVILMLASVIGFFIYMAQSDRYLEHAPNYSQTIYHSDLGDHLESTFEGKDLSSAERIYRWVAGVRMWEANPITGYGPGNFNNFYKAYTVNSFRTYVSDNPERSSIHNYFLLMLTEQGLGGLLFFVLLTIAIFFNGQRIYFQTRDKQEQHYVMAILLCLVIIYVNTFLSDLIETDKIGSMYFMCIALLVNQDIRNKRMVKETAVSAG